MLVSAKALLAAAVLTAAMSAAPANAQSLLGGLDISADAAVDVDLGLGGGGSSLADVTVDLGGNDNTIADVTVGGGNGQAPLANVNVSGGGGQGLLNNGGLLGTGLLDGDDDGGVLGSGILASNLTAGLNLGGLDLNLSLLGGQSGNGGGDSSGGNGNGGVGAGNGNGGVGAGNGIGGIGGGNGAIGGGGGGRVLVSSVGGAGVAVRCSVDDGRQVLQLAAQAKVNPSAWHAAANVQVVPVKLCPQARGQVAQIFRASGKIQRLQNAVAGDALITASLQRTRYDVNDVFAVQTKGGRVTVYVY